MRRFHLFEFEDQPWFPELIRDAGTAYLESAARISGQARAVVPLLSKVLRSARESRIVDLCSGGAGPLPAALALLAKEQDTPVTVTLTDLYPNRNAFERATRDNTAISAVYEPVDAMSVPETMEGVRTMFSGLHHFRPPQARRILASAADAGAPILIVEAVARHPFALLAMFLVPLMTLAAIPLLRPFRCGWLPLTYLVPVIPLFIFWDGIVSCLRCYTQDELREMTADLGADDYGWEIGELDMPGAPFQGNYLIGSPTRSARVDVSASRPASE